MTSRKTESKTKKHQLYMTALVVMRDVLCDADISRADHSIDIHFDRLIAKKPNEEMMYLDVKIAVKGVIKRLCTTKSKNAQKTMLDDIIAEGSNVIY